MRLFRKIGAFIFIIITAIGCTTQQPTGATRGAATGALIAAAGGTLNGCSTIHQAVVLALNAGLGLGLNARCTPFDCRAVLKCLNDNYPDAKTNTYLSHDGSTSVKFQDQHTLLSLSNEPKSSNYIGHCGIDISYLPQSNTTPSNSTDSNFTYNLFLTLYNCKTIKNKEATIDTLKPPPPIKNGTS